MNKDQMGIVMNPTNSWSQDVGSPRIKFVIVDHLHVKYRSDPTIITGLLSPLNIVPSGRGLRPWIGPSPSIEIAFHQFWFVS